MIARAPATRPTEPAETSHTDAAVYAGIPRSSLSVQHCRSLNELRAELPRWEQLYIAAGVTNPFIDPLWLAAWAQHYVRPGELDIMFISGDKHLVGVAPFYRSRTRALGAIGPTRLHLLGAGARDSVSELTETLVLPQRRRAVLRTIISEASSCADWDWLEIALPAEHGWLETQWLPMRGTHPQFLALPKSTTASVILELNQANHAVLLKRNMRRNMRHRRNQLLQQGATAETERLDQPGQIEGGLELLSRLHAARSAMTGVPWHPNMLRSVRVRAFLADSITAMATAKRAAIFVLRINGQPAAAQLVLIANGCYYLAMSGLDPAQWQVSPLTLLTAAIIDDAAANGATRVNLSTGPNSAKLAWSEKVEYSQTVLVVRRSALASARFAGYWQARSLAQLWHEYRQQRRQACA